MSNASVVAFGYRAMDLAYILLTRRKDLLVEREVVYRDRRLDFLVSIGSGEVPTERKLAIEVKALGQQVTAPFAGQNGPGSGKPVTYDSNGRHAFPIPYCLFAFLLRTDEGFFTWLYEPVITTAGRRKLRPGPDLDQPDSSFPVPLHGRWKVLNGAALETIIAQVNDWYDAGEGGS